MIISKNSIKLKFDLKLDVQIQKNLMGQWVMEPRLII